MAEREVSVMQYVIEGGGATAEALGVIQQLMEDNKLSDEERRLAEEIEKLVNEADSRFSAIESMIMGEYEISEQEPEP
jgi:hypothetical protein